MIRVVHPGSRIRILTFYPSRIRILTLYPSLIPDESRGQKGTGSRIRNIANTIAGIITIIFPDNDLFDSNGTTL
jgi:hypothetical protein